MGAKGSLAEFRRLKRIRLADKQKRLIYWKTPTPENYSRITTPVTKFSLVNSYENNFDFTTANKFKNDADIEILKGTNIYQFNLESSKKKFYNVNVTFLSIFDYQEFELFRQFIA